MLAGLLPFTRSPAEPAETEVAVGLEGAHAKLTGQRLGLKIATFGGLEAGGIGVGGDLAQEAEGPRLMAAFTTPTSEHHGAVGAGPGVLDLVREQIRLAKLPDAKRLVIPNPCAFKCGQGLLQEGEALPMASQGVKSTIDDQREKVIE